MDLLKVFIPLSKVDEEQRMVFGYASTEALDSQGDVISKAAIEEALPDYMRFANIREMHTMSAVGVAKSAEVDDKGLYIGAKVVDDAAWLKVKEGVYKGFSIGGKGLAKSDKTITKLRLTEISLVDRPANPECVIDCFKAEALEDEPAAGEPVAKAAEGQPAGEQPPANEPPAVEEAEVSIKLDKATAEALRKLMASPEGAAAVSKALSERAEELRKGFYTLREFASVIENISYLCESTEFEAQYEGDNSPIPGALREWLKTGLGIMQAMTAEEASELSARLEGLAATKKAERTEAIAKRGARFSKATKEALSKVHGMLRECDKAMGEMGYDKDDGEEGADDASKAQQSSPLLQAVEADVAKAANDAGFTLAEGALFADLLKSALGEVGTLRKRVQELEAQPASPKAARTAVAVEKADDTNGNTVVQATEKPDPNDPLSAFKAALSKPMPAIARLGTT